LPLDRERSFLAIPWARHRCGDAGDGTGGFAALGSTRGFACGSRCVSMQSVFEAGGGPAVKVGMVPRAKESQ
jgi:hypothetical protein